MIRPRPASLPLLAAAFAAACSSGERGPGAVSGDVYVVLASGKHVNVANQPVRLVADDAALDSALTRVCAGLRKDFQGLSAAAATEPARVVELRAEATERAWQARTRTLEARSRHGGQTSVEASFLIDGVPEGRYRIWTDATVGEEYWTWLHPVRVRGGDTLRVSLSNANIDEDPFRCQRQEEER